MRSSGTCSRPTKQQIVMAVYVLGHSSTETKIIPSTQYAFLLSSSDHRIMTTCSPSRRSARRSAAVRIAKALQHHARQAASGSEGTSHKSADRSPYWRSRRAASRAPRTGEPRGRVLSAGVPNRGFSPLLGHPWRRRREPFPHLPDGEIFVKWSRRGDKKQKRTLTFFFQVCGVARLYFSGDGSSDDSIQLQRVRIVDLRHVSLFSLVNISQVKIRGQTCEYSEKYLQVIYSKMHLSSS